MGDKTQKEVINQGASESASPSVNIENMEEFLKQKNEEFKQITGMSIEEFFEMQRKAEEQKREQLQLQLKQIETEIATLQVKRQEILKQLGTGITRIRKSNNKEIGNFAFKYIGNEHPEYTGKILSANAIANLLGLNAYYSNAVNWKEKFKSVLIEGNSGGRNPEVAEKIRENVEVVYL